MDMTEHSKKFPDVKSYYDHRIWSKATVQSPSKKAGSLPTSMRKSWVNRMQHKSWPTLCESLLDRLETMGADTATERAEFGVLMVDCCMRGCGADLRPEGDVEDGD